LSPKLKQKMLIEKINYFSGQIWLACDEFGVVIFPSSINQRFPSRTANFLRFSFVLAIVIGLHILKRLYSFAQPTVNLCQLTIDALLVRSI